MKDYFAFGGHLRSELEFPDLSPWTRGGPPDWDLRLADGEPPEPVELRGTREIEPGWVFRLYRVQEGLRLDYGGTGSYGIFAEGREIVWYPGEVPEDREVLLEMARAIVLGPVMALSLEQTGVVCLHGSAVSIGDEAIAFLAPKHHGKSTLALALTAAGARLLSDDLVAIDPSGTPIVRPGVHSVRVKGDVAGRLGARFPQSTQRTGFKTTITNLGADRLAWDPEALTAIYVLEPKAEIHNGVPARRDPLHATRAAAELALGKKLADELIGPAAAGRMLERIALVSTRVPVYRLSLVRDIERLSEVVGEIMRWHLPTVAARDV